MNTLTRPQRYLRKDPNPHIPFAISDADTSVPGDKYVGWVCAMGFIVMVATWIILL